MKLTRPAISSDHAVARLSGIQEPIKLKFNKKLNIYSVQAVLAGYVLR